VVFYSAIKKNEIMSFAGKWMELEIIMLSEVSQVQKDITLDTRQNICNNNPKDTVYQTAG
jgi:hypothetical protein